MLNWTKFYALGGGGGVSKSFPKREGSNFTRKKGKVGKKEGLLQKGAYHLFIPLLTLSNVISFSAYVFL